MDGNGDHEYQCGPFMDGHEKMPHGNQQTSPCFKPPGQSEPVQQTGNSQHHKKNKRKNIDDPELKGFLAVHGLSPEKKYHGLTDRFFGVMIPVASIIREARRFMLKRPKRIPAPCILEKYNGREIISRTDSQPVPAGGVTRGILIEYAPRIPGSRICQP